MTNAKIKDIGITFMNMKVKKFLPSLSTSATKKLKNKNRSLIEFIK